MFSLHETTKISICRAAFVALCVVPTCGVLAWCVAIRMPSYRQSHERGIADQLGLSAQLGKVTSPRPGTILYERLDLADRQTGQLLARLPFVEIETHDRAVSIAFPSPATINGGRLDVAAKILRGQLDWRQDWDELHFEAQNLSLHLPDGDQTLTQVLGEIQHTDDQSRLKLNFTRTGGNGASPTGPAELTIARVRSIKPPHSTYRFATGSAPLPCSLASALVPSLAALGKRSAFQGEVSAVESLAGWTATLKGRLTEVDLDGLFRGRFAHRLSGTAEVKLDDMALRDGRALAATGQLAAGPGQLSRSLVQSAHANLKFKVAPAALSGKSNVLTYSQLCLAFQLDGQGLIVRGTCPQQPGSVLIGEQNAVLVHQGEAARQPSLNLVRMLVPNHDLQVPAARETDWLTHFLPIPSSYSRPGSEEAVPTVELLRIKRK